MSKPSIGSLLTLSGFSASTISRAINSLYGNIGVNLDERNWTAISASADPLSASENALLEMYQNSAYLLRNANNLLALNYTPNQIVYTYHQITQRLALTYSADWATGTRFAELANLPFDTLRHLAINDPPNDNGATPILTLGNDATGLLAQSDLAGRLIFTDGTQITNLTAGVNQALAVLGALKSGQVAAVSAANRQSTASTQTVTLGTAAADVYDASGVGAVVQYVFTGAGNDIITGGAGADIIYAGDDDDIIRGSQEDIRLNGGNGNDRLEISANFTVNGIFQLRDFEEIRLMVDGLTLNLTGSFSTATIRGFAAGASTATGSNGPDVFIGGNGNDTFIGGAESDTFTGGAGNDSFTGGTNDDTFNIDAGTDHITDLQGSDVFVILAGATLNADVAQEYTATAASRNTGGGPANAVFTVSMNADFADFSLVTVANAATDGLTINSDHIFGGGVITGTAGNDIITGGGVVFNLATEVLIGGAGDDAITGGTGADQLTGGTGVDTFIFAAGASGGTDAAPLPDQIMDFLAGTDKLRFAGVNPAASAQQAAVQAAVTALAAGSTEAQIAAAMAFANTTDLGVAFAVFNNTDTYVYFETTGAPGTHVELANVFIRLVGLTVAPTFAADVIAFNFV